MTSTTVVKTTVRSIEPKYMPSCTKAKRTVKPRKSGPSRNGLSEYGSGFFVIDAGAVKVGRNAAGPAEGAHGRALPVGKVFKGMVGAESWRYLDRE